MSGEEHRRALLAHAIATGRFAQFAQFVDVIARHDLAAVLLVDAALPKVIKDPEFAAMIVIGHFGRERTPHGVVTLSLIPRTKLEARIGELNRAVAPPVAFGEVRVVVLDGDDFLFGSVAIAPSTSGVLA